MPISTLLLFILILVSKLLLFIFMLVSTLLNFILVSKLLLFILMLSLPVISVPPETFSSSLSEASPSFLISFLFFFHSRVFYSSRLIIFSAFFAKSVNDIGISSEGLFGDLDIKSSSTFAIQ